MMDLGLNDVILAQNMLLQQQLEEMTKQLANLPKMFAEMQESSSNQKVRRCELCFGSHPTGFCAPQEEHVHYIWKQEPEPSDRPPLSYQPPEQDRITKLEDTFNQFMEISMVNQRNTNASIKSLEIQVGLLATQMAEHQKDKLAANDEKVDGQKIEEGEEIVEKENKEEIQAEVSSKTLEESHNHQNIGMDFQVEHIGFVFGDMFDQYTPFNSSIHMFILDNLKYDCDAKLKTCEFYLKEENGRELRWSKKRKEKTMAKKIKRPRKKNGLFFNHCLWSP